MNSHVRPRARIGVGIGLAAALLLAACSTGNESESSAAGGSSGSSGSSGCTIGMTQINQTAVFFTQMNEGAQEAAKEAGCDLTIANANNDSRSRTATSRTSSPRGSTA